MFLPFMFEKTYFTRYLLKMKSRLPNIPDKDLPAPSAILLWDLDRNTCGAVVIIRVDPGPPNRVLCTTLVLLLWSEGEVVVYELTHLDEERGHSQL